MGSEVAEKVVEAVADSPTSVLGDEETCDGEAITRCVTGEARKPEGHTDAGGDLDKHVKEEEVNLPIELETKNGDTSLISKAMTEEEECLLEMRAKAEEQNEMTDAKPIGDHVTQFSKLDELLTQTQLYSQFLLEKMDDITFNANEAQVEEEATAGKKGRKGRKRKATVQYNERKAKTAVAAMLIRSQSGSNSEDAELTEEERAEKEQAELVPLLTGGKLKPYQLKGVKWLISLWQNGLNGILADQMGLGKTIQTIGFLAHLKGKGLHGPYLVIAPLSTLSNWVNEISRFVPSINAVIYHGSKQDRQEIRRKFMPQTIGPKFPIIVTSYEIVLNDARTLSAYKWKYVIVDEGHRLKNTNCLLLRELRRLPIENKLLLTGTPLQNNLAELWSLLNFILPDIFSSYQEFESWFDLSGKFTNESDEESDEKRRLQVVSKLHSILRPFLLRRVKDDVEKMLPKKKEIILYATMSEHQREIRNHLLNKTFDEYVKKENGDRVMVRSGMKRKLHNVVMQLRKNCNHPDLLDSAYDESYLYPPVDKLLEQCGKFQLLHRLLTLLLNKKHKVLIFSQFTTVLDIIEYFVSEKGLEVCRIDGKVKLDERKKQIDDFNDLNSTVNVFLLSTRAGGLGINLTSADTCIIYDSDWNPQMDLQAMDRCHRIGQTRPVHVYRLITAHSVEGRILRKAFDKLKLEHVVIGKGQFEQEKAKSNALDESELLALLKNEESEEDKFVQTNISDEDLVRVLDRSDLIRQVQGGGKEGKVDGVVPIPVKGPGWEVVIPVKSGGGMLSAVGS